MIRPVLCILLLAAGPAFAAPGAVETPRQTAPIDPMEEYWKSEEGRDVQRLFDEYLAGKKTFEQTREEYNRKWSGKPLPASPSQVPDAPLTPFH